MVRGSTFGDLLIGSNGSQLEFFDGRGGNDTISGGAGNDQAMYQSATAAVNVNLATGSATDGEGGTDSLISIERVRGSAFADTLIGSSATWESFEGMEGNDTISGGGGTDRYDVLNWSTAAATINLTTGTATDGQGGTDALDSIENVRATNFNDTVVGSAADNGVSGGSGADEVSGLAGLDTLMGDNGNDTLNGGADNDQLFGDAGDDTLIGGTGDDVLTGDTTADSGADRLTGDAGNDTLFGGDGADVLSGGLGGDQLIGGNGDDTLLGGVGDDVYFGDGGADRFQITSAGGDDTIADFEAGVDKIDLQSFAFGTYAAFLAAITADLTFDNGFKISFTAGGSLTVIRPASFTSNDFLL
jgi:Ca2+-binding RTX toxin-like protein